MSNPPLICLDRDGVINEDSDAYVKNPEEWIPIPGSLKAIADLTKAGFQMVVISNQAGIVKGKFTQNDLDAMTQKMLALIESSGGKIQKVFYCTHDPDEGCRCRKPAPGMLLDAASLCEMEPKHLLMLGDRATDVETALMCGATPILLKSGKGQRELAQNPLLAQRVIEAGGAIYEDLAEFARVFLSR